MPDPTRAHESAAPSIADPPAAAGPADRYVLGDEIARGGMGVVYRATDTALARDVAVKVLHDKFGPASGAAARFADEARITAQLQHPGIPPVHDLGTLPDGRPFLAMKLIRGDTLDELLKERPDPAADRGRFVAAFEQVCQAVAYAHARGVIHRDLKPANVMVGDYGEVQVMDWGLAKVLAPRSAAADDPDATTGGTEVRTLRDSDDLLTQAGSVLGTPAFMPPEQAAGAVGKVDARSDVFGLGAILAVVLTGRPPFAGSSAETTRVKAAQGDVADCLARLDACGADPELVTLAKRCLAPKPDDRPADAGEVATAVADLRQAADDRVRQAELDRVSAESKAAEQLKRRKVQLALAAAVLVLLAGAGSFAWWQDREASARKLAEGRRSQAEDQKQRADERAALAREIALHNEAMVYLYNAMLLLPGGNLTGASDVRQAASYLETAVELFETAVRDFPDNPSHQYFLGWAYEVSAVVSLVADPPRTVEVLRALSDKTKPLPDEAFRARIAPALAMLDRAEPLVEPFEHAEARALLTSVSSRPSPGLAPLLRTVRQIRLWAYFTVGRASEALIVFDQLYPAAAAATPETPYPGEPVVPTHKELENLLATPARFGYDHLPADELLRLRLLILRASEEEQSKILITGRAKDDFPKLLRLAEALAASRGVAGQAVYNAGCAFSLASAEPGIEVTLREERAARATAYLQRLQRGGYFEHPTRGARFRREFETDPDLNPLRGRAEFQTLLRAVRGEK